MKKCIVFISSCALKLMDECAIEYSKRLGYEVVVVMDTAENNNLNVDYLIVSNTDCANSIITDLVDFSNKHEISAILTYSDYHVEVTALVNQYFKLKGTDYSATLKCKNKFLCRRTLDQNALHAPQHRMIKDKKDVLAALHDLGLPLVIKPINGMGSMYTAIIESSQSAGEVFDWLKSKKEESQFGREKAVSDRWIAEQCLNGYQISVESYTVNSLTTIVCVHDKLNNIEPPLFRVFYSATPSERINEELEEEIRVHTKKILSKIGFDNGVAHTEYRISGNGDIQLLEINARPGGGLIIPSAYYSTGINLFTVAIDIALNRMPHVPECPTKNPVVFRVVYPKEEGEIVTFDDGGEDRADSSIKVCEKYSSTGDVVGIAQRLAMILKQGTLNDSISDLVKDINKVVENWNIEIAHVDSKIPPPKHIQNSAHI